MKAFGSVPDNITYVAGKRTEVGRSWNDLPRSLAALRKASSAGDCGLRNPAPFDHETSSGQSEPD